MTDVGTRLYEQLWVMLREITGDPDARLVVEAVAAANGIDLDELAEAWRDLDLVRVQAFMALMRRSLEA